ncbi:MAG: DUF503 domain-containing protein [Acidimicrobiia bacterium]|nr:DUF503 domain-containing protein [Acidimicrobiia bacterium]
MHAAALRAEIRLPNTHSLKEKRRKMRTVTNQLDKLGLSVSEVDFQDQWQRSTIGVAAVAPQHSQLVRVLRSVVRTLRSLDEIELLDVYISHLERPE